VTTPADPNRPDNGYQSGLPSYPSAPPPSEAQAQTITPPTEIIASFWCYVVAATIVLVGGLLFSGAKQQVRDTLRVRYPTYTPTQLDSLANVTVTLAVAFAVLIGALYLLFAFKIKAGRNWARIVLTIVAVLDLLTIIGGRGGSAVGYVGALAAVIGCVLSYVPKSAAYIAEVRASRQLR
jgi:hypothetical protein